MSNISRGDPTFSRRRVGLLNPMETCRTRVIANVHAVFVYILKHCVSTSYVRGSGETAVIRRLAHAIKTIMDCVSLSSKCTYVLNGSSKGSSEAAQMRILV